jgi:hypothetical protein
MSDREGEEMGSLYSEMDGLDHSKVIVSNGWDEDSDRISGDSMHEFIFCRKSIDRSISMSIDVFEQ